MYLLISRKVLLVCSCQLARPNGTNLLSSDIPWQTWQRVCTIAVGTSSEWRMPALNREMGANADVWIERTEKKKSSSEETSIFVAYLLRALWLN